MMKNNRSVVKEFIDYPNIHYSYLSPYARLLFSIAQKPDYQPILMIEKEIE